MEALAIGSAGVIAASNRFSASAQRVAEGTGDLATETVDMISAGAAFRASLAVVRSGDAMFRRLLDIKV